MQFVSVRDLRGKSSAIWEKLRSEREMVITSNGKPIAVLSAVSDITLEETLRAIRRAVAVSSVTAMQEHSVRSGLDACTAEDINAAIAEVRRRKRA
jgi:antitoxin (DNA-binding transcriptional repressor) of toxin-antitoxin stability system